MTSAPFSLAISYVPSMECPSTTKIRYSNPAITSFTPSNTLPTASRSFNVGITMAILVAERLASTNLSSRDQSTPVSTFLTRHLISFFHFIARSPLRYMHACIKANASLLALQIFKNIRDAEKCSLRFIQRHAHFLVSLNKGLRLLLSTTYRLMHACST